VYGVQTVVNAGLKLLIFVLPEDGADVRTAESAALQLGSAQLVM
jgi:hypothetical protein